MFGMRARRAHHTLPAHLLRFAVGQCGVGVPPARGRSGFVIGNERVEDPPDGARVGLTLCGWSRSERPLTLDPCRRLVSIDSSGKQREPVICDTASREPSAKLEVDRTVEVWP